MTEAALPVKLGRRALRHGGLFLWRSESRHLQPASCQHMPVRARHRVCVAHAFAAPVAGRQCKIDEPAKCYQHDAGSNQSAKGPLHGYGRSYSRASA